MKGRALAVLCVLGIASFVSDARGDETCLSPFLPKITGQEDYLYVYTLGVEGVGDGNDKLVTIGTNPSRPGYGKVVHVAAMPGRHEAHHGDFTDDRRHLWLGGLDTSEIFVFDVATEPGKPKLVKTIKDFVAKSGGVVGPHTFNALPGRMLITGLSNAQDGGGRTGMVEYSNAGEHVRTVWMPKGAEYGYDARINVNLNRLLTSSFTGKKNYMRPLPELMGDAEAMKQFGHTMVVWDAHARKPLQTLSVPNAPLEIRWALDPRHYYAFTATALDSRLWGVFRKDDGTFEAVNLAPIGDPAKLPLLTVDISLSADDRFLFANNFVSGMVHVFDVSNARQPKQVYERKIGEQVNMVSQTWDGKRVYFSSSLLANWDKTGPGNDQFVRAFDWDGQKLEPRFAVDFNAEKLGRPHIMRFGQEGFWAGRTAPSALGE
jgi:selenium-binding protein 1